MKRTVTTKTYAQAFELVKKIVEIAEQANHHPSLQWDYCELTITLSTHDEGDVVTEKDRFVARQIDKAFSDVSSLL